MVESGRDRVRANADALAGLLSLAERLRRTNAAKWGIGQPEWEVAVRAVATAPVPHPDDPARLAQAIRAGQSAGRRLGNAGEARFGSAYVGRQPDSSLAGRRFLDDVALAQQCLAELRSLQDAEPGAAADGGGM